MEIEEPVMQGLLLFPPQGMLGQLKKTWHKRYCQLFKASKAGIERLEVWDSRDDYLNQQSSSRIITLEACIKIGPSNQSKVFVVVTKTNAYHFGCYTEAENYDWINAFQQVAFKDDPSSQTLEEDNDLYCTSGEGVFSVKLVETEASKRCGLEPKHYTLIIAEVDMKLLDGDVLLFVWPYRFIRKYGYRDGKFTFDAGRKCESGEGSFKLQHSNQQEIYRCISSKMQSMKQLLRGETTGNVSMQSTSSNASTIDLNDVQYHAALSMEAGSRSPLPPTPNINSVNFMDVDFSTISFNSQKPLIPTSNSSNYSLDSIPFIRPPPPIVKPKPAKPPRKYVFPGLIDKKTMSCDLSSMSPSGSGRYRKYNAYSSPELSRKSGPSSVFNDRNFNIDDIDEKHPYDIVEVRNNAWKTHGIGTIPHTERVNKTSPLLPHEGKHEKIEYVEVKVQRVATGDSIDVKEINVNFDEDSKSEQNLIRDHNYDDDDNDDDDDDDDDEDEDDDDDDGGGGGGDDDDDDDDSFDCENNLRNDNDDHHNNNQNNKDGDIKMKNEYSFDIDKVGSNFPYETLKNENNTLHEINTASPFIHNNLATTSDAAPNYDKLQHIGSSYKLDNNPGYKIPNQTLSIARRKNASPCDASSRSIDDSNPSWNDYDIVEDISAIRLADDSSRGYGVIRKKNSSSSGPLQHKVFNNSEYAIVSKPKRV